MKRKSPPLSGVPVLVSLRNNASITICEADKNLGTVILDTPHYNRLVMQHLLNRQVYRQIPLPYVRHVYHQRVTSGEYRTTLETYAHTIRNSIPYCNPCPLKYLLHHIDTHRTIPNFRVLPKVHKDGPLTVRPITSITNWVTKPPAIFIDSFMQQVLVDPLHKPFNFILKDSKSLIRDLENKRIPQTAILFSLDVVSMYTNISKGILLNTLYSDPSIPIAISMLIEFTFSLSFVHYNGLFFEQIDGIPMGSHWSVNMANYFMLQLFERDPWFQIQQDFLMSYYRRYIDDIIGIWTGTHFQLIDFFNNMNVMVPEIRFTLVQSLSQITVLDTVLYTVPDPFDPNFKIIKFRLHQKELNPYLYIPFNSSHPPHIFSGFITGELIRYARNNTSEFHFHSSARLFKARLVRRGYPFRFLEKVFNSRDFFARRHDYLIDRPKPTRAVLPFVTRFTKLSYKLKFGRFLHAFKQQMA